MLEAIAALERQPLPGRRGARTPGRGWPHGTASSPDEVHVGSGSVAILAQLIQAAAGPGDEVVYAWRSFEAYPAS